MSHGVAVVYIPRYTHGLTYLILYLLYFARLEDFENN